MWGGWLIVLILMQTAAGAVGSSLEPSFQLDQLPAPCTTGTANNILTGDFNGDHKPDLAIVCEDSSSKPPSAEISVLLGNGDGTFQAPLVSSLASLKFGYATLLSRLSPFSLGAILAVDVNGDGRTDVVFNAFGSTITVNTPNAGLTFASSNITVMLAGADGTLGAPSTVSGGTPYFVEAAADVNADGIPDLVLDGGGAVGFPVGFAVMLGKPGGSFSAPSPLPAPAASLKPVINLVADFTSAGTPDIVFTSDANGNTYILVNLGMGSFQPPALITGLPIQPFLAGDFTGNGKPDIAAVGQIQLGGGDQLVVALGNGDGTFQQPAAPRGVYGTTLVALDLNGDGKLDLAQADGSLVAFYISNGDGTFQALPPLSLGAAFAPTVVADFNGDGKPDMADTASVAINTTVIATTTGALNGASFASSEPLAPGSLVSIFGADFATSNAEAAAIPLPPTLGGVSVRIGGFPAPLLFVSASQINVQVPWEVSGNTADIVVTTAQGAALAPFSASVGPMSPGIFTTQSGKGQAIAINPDGSLAGPTGSIPGLAVHPAQVGDVLEILATGLGTVSPAIADGSAAGDTLRNTTATPTVMIGGAAAPLLFSGLSPQFVGVNQINVTVPEVAAGVVALQISMGEIVTSNLVTIAVQNP
jgi:uncharacterized protein (TIGR03437 family)